MDKVAKGSPIWALGLMSGTSMDGVDAALVLTDGEGIAGIGPAVSLPMDAALGEDAKRYRGIMDHAAFELAEELAGGPTRDPALTGLATDLVVRLNFAGARAVIAQAQAAPQLAGLHGQTILHRPGQAVTCQIGDGAALARELGVPVVSDFRSKDMRHGGEGAPLAPFFHFACARHIGAERPVAFLNIGGVANVTWVDPAADRPDAPGALLAFDTGPGNALLDDFIKQHTGSPHDDGGATAAAGVVDWMSLGRLPAFPYLDRAPPKSLDRNDFHPVLDAVSGLSTEDGAATLTAFSADCVAAALPHLPSPPTRWLVCGGGRKNLTLMRMLRERLHVPVEPVEAVGLDGDMLEAQAFAWLAVRVLRGLPTSAPSTTGCRAPVCGGRISYP